MQLHAVVCTYQLPVVIQELSDALSCVLPLPLTTAPSRTLGPARKLRYQLSAAHSSTMSVSCHVINHDK